MNPRTRSLINGWLLAILFVLLVNIGLAQTDPAASPAAPGLPQNAADKAVAFLTPFLVPAILAGVKQVLPRLPTFVIPLLAPVLGLLIGFINNLISTHPGNLWLAAGLGLLGVAVREVKEGVLPAANGGWPATPPAP